MEPLLGLLAIGAASYGAVALTRLSYRAVRNALNRHWSGVRAQAGFGARHQVIAAQRRRQVQRLNQLARNLQISLLRIGQARDFRRAASWAQQAQSLPLEFRQRQYRRFRQRLVQHAAARITAGENREVLLESLRALVRNLGVASFEADYLWAEAQQRLPQAASAPAPFIDQMHSLQQEHERRMAALRSLPGLESEIREQLLEAEQQRFRDAMLEREDQPSGEMGI